MAQHRSSRAGNIALIVVLIATSCNQTDDKKSSPQANVAASADKDLEKPTPAPQEKKEDSSSDDKKVDVIVRTNPLEPENEVYLNNWRFFIYGIDDKGRIITGNNYGVSDWEGYASLKVDDDWTNIPLIVIAYNDILPFEGCGDGECGTPDDALGLATCRQFEIFIPAGCYTKGPFMVSPFEDEVWNYYRNANSRHGEGWNATQVDCDTWLTNLNLLLLNDRVQDELSELDNNQFGIFREEILVKALQENQQLLTPTRPPICMSENRHNGGGMDDGEIVTLPITLDDSSEALVNHHGFSDIDPVIIGDNGIVSDLCDISFNGFLTINSSIFMPQISNRLKDRQFLGVVSNQTNITPNIDVSVYNTRLGNGRELDSEIYEDACAITSVIEMTNTSADEKTLKTNTGVTFLDLFGAGENTKIYLTSDGDRIVDDNDYWAIFYEEGGGACLERVLAVELLGHRQGDFRDVLHITYDDTTENLFLGQKADHELEEEEIDGERAFISYTLHVWDGSSPDTFNKIRTQFASCYLAADVWALQFFKLRNAELTSFGSGEDCSTFCPLELAEFAVRSQCFSNSRSNQRWQSDDAGYWSINSTHNVESNIIINPGWLGPHLNYGIYVQKFDEAVFKGPRTIRTTDEVGQMMIELPTLVEGDRVLIKAEDSCCDDYDLIIPCVPAFTGFAGETGVAYVPSRRGDLPLNQ